MYCTAATLTQLTAATLLFSCALFLCTAAIQNSSVHIVGLSSCEEFIAADSSNFVYRPSELQSNGIEVLLIESFGDEYTDANIESLRTALAPSSSYDVEWSRRFATLMDTRMTPRLSICLVMYVILHLQAMFESKLKVSVVLVRENVRLTLNLVKSGAIKIDTHGMNDEYERSGAQLNHMNICVACGVRLSSVRCASCRTHRFCTTECRDGASEHRSSCGRSQAPTASAAAAPMSPVREDAAAERKVDALAAIATARVHDARAAIRAAREAGARLASGDLF